MIERKEVKVLVADLENEHQADIELLMYPHPSDHGTIYDLTTMIRMAMEHYTLNPLFYIHVDYWIDSIQTFVTSDMPWNMNEEALIQENDLHLDKDGKLCLILRIRNCLGNIVDLSLSQP